MTDGPETPSKPPRVRVGQGAPDHALTMAYLPLSALVTLLIAGLFSFAFVLGLAPPVISLVVLAGLIGAVAVTSGQRSLGDIAGTRITLAHISLVSLLAGVALAPPDNFLPLMQWSLAAMGAATVAIVGLDVWLCGKVGAANEFSRALARQVLGVLIVSLALILWRGEIVGVWVIAVALVHYLGPLSAKFSRTSWSPSTAIWRPYVTAGVILFLAAALVPDLPSDAGSGLAGIALALALIATFVDIKANNSQN